MADYLPSNDEQLGNWMTNFLTRLETDIAIFQMVPADIAILQAVATTFGTQVTEFRTAREAALARARDKQNTKAVMKLHLRPIVNRINNHPAMTDGMRSEYGLHPRNLAMETVPITQLQPVVLLRATLGQVDVHWGPNPANENRNGKPAGVMGANIYRRKTGEEEFAMVGFTTSSPYIDQHTGPATDWEYVVRYRGTKPSDLSAQSDFATVAVRGVQAA